MEEDSNFKVKKIMVNPGARPSEPDLSNPDHNSSILSALYFFKFLFNFEYRSILFDKTDFNFLIPLKHFKNILLGFPSLLLHVWYFTNKCFLAKRKLPSLFISGKKTIYYI